ncbi:MAG: primosomal replication protein [Pseudomonadota bacterium]|jgi:primosomal replication protein N
MNRVLLSARIVERQSLRYTPAGLPALDVVLNHESEVTEAQLPRKVKLDVKAVAMGPVANRLAQVAVGELIELEGFLGAPRNGRGVLLHITDFTASVQPKF